jgi:hypothetical protein
MPHTLLSWQQGQACQPPLRASLEPLPRYKVKHF